MNGGSLGNAISGSKNSTSTVGSVSIAIAGIIVIVHKVSTFSGAASKLLVGASHTGIHNIDVHSSSGDVVLKSRIQWKIGLVKSIQTPLSIVLVVKALCILVF